MRWQTSSCSFPTHYYGKRNNVKKGTTLAQSFITALQRHVAKPCKQVHANMKNDVLYACSKRILFFDSPS